VQPVEFVESLELHLAQEAERARDPSHSRLVDQRELARDPAARVVAHERIRCDTEL